LGLLSSSSALPSFIQRIPYLIQGGSALTALIAEAGTFELTLRSLNTARATGQSPLQDRSPNLWSWSGPGGLQEGWFNSIITFGSLKTMGRLTQGENHLLQHVAQDVGMVGSHHLAHLVGWREAPQGSLGEQLAHAEATLAQLNAGMGLVHAAFPRLAGMERSLDVAVSLRSPSPLRERAGGEGGLSLLQANLSLAGISDGLPFLPNEKTESKTETQWFAKGHDSGGKQNPPSIRQLKKRAFREDEEALKTLTELSETDPRARKALVEVFKKYEISGKNFESSLRGRDFHSSSSSELDIPQLEEQVAQGSKSATKILSQLVEKDPSAQEALQRGVRRYREERVKVGLDDPAIYFPEKESQASAKPDPSVESADREDSFLKKLKSLEVVRLYAISLARTACDADFLKDPADAPKFAGTLRKRIESLFQEMGWEDPALQKNYTQTFLAELKHLEKDHPQAEWVLREFEGKGGSGEPALIKDPRTTSQKRAFQDALDLVKTHKGKHPLFESDIVEINTLVTIVPLLAPQDRVDVALKVYRTTIKKDAIFLFLKHFSAEELSAFTKTVLKDLENRADMTDLDRAYQGSAMGTLHRVFRFLSPPDRHLVVEKILEGWNDFWVGAKDYVFLTLQMHFPFIDPLQQTKVLTALEAFQEGPDADLSSRAREALKKIKSPKPLEPAPNLEDVLPVSISFGTTPPHLRRIADETLVAIFTSFDAWSMEIPLEEMRETWDELAKRHPEYKDKILELGRAIEEVEKIKATRIFEEKQDNFMTDFALGRVKDPWSLEILSFVITQRLRATGDFLKSNPAITMGLGKRIREELGINAKGEITLSPFEIIAKILTGELKLEDKKSETPTSSRPRTFDIKIVEKMMTARIGSILDASKNLGSEKAYLYAGAGLIFRLLGNEEKAKEWFRQANDEMYYSTEEAFLPPGTYDGIDKYQEGLAEIDPQHIKGLDEAALQIMRGDLHAAFAFVDRLPSSEEKMDALIYLTESITGKPPTEPEVNDGLSVSKGETPSSKPPQGDGSGGISGPLAFIAGMTGLKYLLGNIADHPVSDLMTSSSQVAGSETLTVLTAGAALLMGWVIRRSKKHEERTPKKFSPTEEGSSILAQPNLEKVALYEETRQIGRGSSQLSSGGPGPGVRAGHLREGSERVHHLSLGFEKRQGQRLKEYRRLINSAIDGASEEVLSERLVQIYENFQDEFPDHTFLAPSQMRRLAYEMLREEMIEEGYTFDEVGSVWEMTIESLEARESSKEKDES